MDINEKLLPTYVGDISESSFYIPDTYDLVLCAEVLEHIPFEQFDICLQNIWKSTKKYACITLPNCRKNRLRIGIRVNRHYKEIGILPYKKPIYKGHFWELNYEDRCTTKNVRKHMERFFSVIEEGVVKGNPYHYYYILEKKSEIGV